jgi:hypothetical protein
VPSEFEYQTSWDPEVENIVSGVFTPVLMNKPDAYYLAESSLPLFSSRPVRPSVDVDAVPAKGFV